MFDPVCRRAAPEQRVAEEIPAEPTPMIVTATPPEILRVAKSVETAGKVESVSGKCSAFIEKAKRFRTIDVLAPELLRLFIQRIEIGERAKKYSHSAAQDIRIVYRDIGMVDSNMEKGE